MNQPLTLTTSAEAEQPVMSRRKWLTHFAAAAVPGVLLGYATASAFEWLGYEPPIYGYLNEEMVRLDTTQTVADHFPPAFFARPNREGLFSRIPLRASPSGAHDRDEDPGDERFFRIAAVWDKFTSKEREGSGVYPATGPFYTYARDTGHFERYELSVTSLPNDSGCADGVASNKAPTNSQP